MDLELFQDRVSLMRQEIRFFEVDGQFCQECGNFVELLLAAAWLGGGDLNGRGHVDIELVEEGEWIARPRRGINDEFEGLGEDASRIMVGEIRPRIVVG